MDPSDPAIQSLLESINGRLGTLAEASLPGRDPRRLLRLQSTWIERFLEGGSPQESLFWLTTPSSVGIGESGRIYEITGKKTFGDPNTMVSNEMEVSLGRIQVMREGRRIDRTALLANRVEIVEKLAEALSTSHTHVLAAIESCGHPLQQLALIGDDE